MRARDGGRRALSALVLVGMAALLSGACRMDAEVALDVAPDGSGEVQVAVVLDAEAAERVGDVAAALRLDDLAGAGWTVEGPDRRAEGSVRVAASKPFATAAGADEVLAEVAGEGGPLQGLELERRRSFLVTTFTFTGEVDLTAGVDGFSDDDLRRRLEGSGFGLGTVELEEVTGAPVADTFGMEVRVELPGGPGADAAVWRPTIGEVTTLAATSRSVNVERVVWLAVAVSTALAVVVLLALRFRRRTRDVIPPP